MAKKRTRRLKSVATELVKKAREAMLTSVQVFNNPQIEFKSELFIVTNIIAWTYLLHAHYGRRRSDTDAGSPGASGFSAQKMAQSIIGASRTASTPQTARSTTS